ncbi:MAG: helix-turn-helix domain-containing protein [archaeon]
METELLESIGLTRSEIKVYFALLELGSSSKGPIVNKSGVASSKIYELLEKLIQKGLVSEVVKANTKYFEAAPPKRILDYVQEKETHLEKQKKELEELIPSLELKRVANGIGSQTQVFKGMKGAATAFDDIFSELKEGDEYIVMGISEFPEPFERFVQKFHAKRARKKIKCKIIVNTLARNIGEKLGKVTLTKIRYLPPELFTPFVFIVYKDKTLISIALDEIFVQIKSKNLSNGLRAYANYLWKIGKA